LSNAEKRERKRVKKAEPRRGRFATAYRRDKGYTGASPIKKRGRNDSSMNGCFGS